MVIQPYSDEYLTYDEQSGMYILTEQALLDEYGDDLNAEAIDANNLVAVKAILKRVSRAVYNFIHSFNTQNHTQDLMIARSSTARDMIKEALLEEYLYIRINGYTFDDTVPNAVKTILERKLPEWRFYSVLYSGTLPCLDECNERFI